MLALQSPYTSSIVRVYVGRTKTLFNVHADVLAHAPVLQSQISQDLDDKSITLPKISASVFYLVLQFLYGCSNHDLEKAFDALDQSLNREEDMTGATCEVLCFAFEYELFQLEAKVASSFQLSIRVKVKLILSTAIAVYTTKPIISAWVQQVVYDTTQEALKAHPDLVDETWFMEIFEHGYNGLGKHLFTCYKEVMRSTEHGYPSPKPTSLPESKLAPKPELVSEPGLVSQPDPASESQLVRVLEAEVIETDCWGSWTSLGLLPAAQKTAKKKANFESIVPTPQPSPAPSLSPSFERKTEDVSVSGEIVSREIEGSQTATSIGQGIVNDSVQSNTCSKRRKHLKNEKRWKACASCLKEVEKMARDAAGK